MNKETIESGRKYAIISYITIFGTIVSLFMNKDKKNPFTSFHVRQAFGIWSTWAALGLIIEQLDNGLISLIFLFIMICMTIYCLINAIVGNLVTLPIVGNLYQKIFSSIQ